MNSSSQNPLFAEYSVEVFNSLADVKEACLVIDPRSEQDPFIVNFAKTLGPIFVEGEITDVAALTLLHKHFDLKSGERLVENIEGNYSVLRPESYSDESVTPYLWRIEIGTDGAPIWRPLEFVRACSAASEKYRELFENGEVIEKLGNALVTTGLNQYLGIMLLHRTHSNEPIETTHHQTRTQILTPLEDVAELQGDIDTRRKQMANHLQTGALVRTIFKVDPSISDDIVFCVYCGSCGACGWYHDLRSLSEGAEQTAPAPGVSAARHL